jgi:hypothetical protein
MSDRCRNDYEYTIGLVPRGASRPRAARGGGRVYMPPEHRAWMEAAVVMLREQRQGEQFAGPVAVEIVAYWPLPKARPAWCTRERWKDRVATLGIPYATKPDADNVSKMVLDALVDAGILVDDAIVVELNVLKRAIPEAARIEVWIEER